MQRKGLNILTLTAAGLQTYFTEKGMCIGSYCSEILWKTSSMEFIYKGGKASCVMRVTVVFLPHHIHLFCCIPKCTLAAYIPLQYYSTFSRELRLFPLMLTKTISLSALNEDCRAFQIMAAHSLSCLGLCDIDERRATAFVKWRSQSQCNRMHGS